ncbi:MAG: glycosyltransferase family 4 protein [Armatimonadota bacterium]
MKSATRILFIHQTGGWGGAGIMLANIISALDRRQFAPVVVCPPGAAELHFANAGAEVRIAPRPLYQFTHLSGYQYPCCHPAFLRGAVMQRLHRTFWRDYIRESAADIVHLTALTLAPMAWSARAAGARVLCCVQETAVRGWFGVRTRWLRHVLSTAMDAVTFISEYDRAAARCAAPLVEVIPNWVDATQWDATYPQAQARQQFDLPADGRVVLMMGGIDPLKGTLPLLEAMAQLQDLPNTYVLIAGDGQAPARFSGWRKWRQALRQWPHGDYWQRTMNFIASRQLGPRVRLIGMQSRLMPVYAATDVVVFPATSAHQARPVIEAGIMKKPVVMTDYPQIHEFVQDGVNGLLAPPGNTAALAQALRRLLQDAALAGQYGEANYRVTCARHLRETNAPRFVALYEQLRKEHSHG